MYSQYCIDYAAPGLLFERDACSSCTLLALRRYQSRSYCVGGRQEIYIICGIHRFVGVQVAGLGHSKFAWNRHNVCCYRINALTTVTNSRSALQMLQKCPSDCESTFCPHLQPFRTKDVNTVDAILQQHIATSLTLGWQRQKFPCGRPCCSCAHVPARDVTFMSS